MPVVLRFPKLSLSSRMDVQIFSFDPCFKGAAESVARPSFTHHTF